MASQDRIRLISSGGTESCKASGFCPITCVAPKVTSDRAEQSRQYYLKNREKILKKRKAKREQINRYKRERCKDNEAYVRKIKEATPCADCGINYPWYVKDFDHVRGTKYKNISRLVFQTASRATIDQELAKCDVVCSNCHRERSFQRRDWGKLNKTG